MLPNAFPPTTKEELEQQYEAIFAECIGKISATDFLLASLHAKLDALRTLYVRREFPNQTEEGLDAYNQNEQLYQATLRLYLSFLIKNQTPS